MTKSRHEGDSFRREVRDAISHLDDRVYLAVHPLVQSLVAPSTTDPDRALRRILLDAIDALRPTSPRSSTSAPWRRYEHVRLRYIEGNSLARVAQDLAVSVRQAIRDHDAALDAMSSYLWAIHARNRPIAVPEADALTIDVDRAPSDDSSTDPRLPVADRPPTRRHALDEELARIGSSPTDATVTLDDVVGGALATIAPLARQNQVSFSVDCPAALPPVRIGRDVLRQIVLGLVDFAVHHAIGQTVRIRARPAESDVDLDLVFHLPSGVDAPSSSAYLDVSQRLATREGCQLAIHADSTTSLATVTLAIPSATTALVLVIDDTEDLGRLFQRYVDTERYQIVQVRTGAEGLRRARAKRPAAITLDVLMPLEDGWQTLQALKEDPSTQNIPVIVCSVLAEPSLALSLGASAFLPKPVRPKTLQAALDRVVAGLS